MYYVVVNPASKTGNGKRIWEKNVEPYLKKKQLSYKLYMSSGPGDIAAIARNLGAEATEKPIHAILLGGDGTMDEFLQGIEHPEDFILGYIPTGSSNDLARSLGIPSDPQEALEIICAKGHPSMMDLGKITFSSGESHLFSVSCGIGFDAAVCVDANKSTLKEKLNKLSLGKLIYLCIAVKQIFSAKRVSGTISFDDNSPVSLKRILFISGQNQRYEGGGFMFAPEAKDNDGLLDICTVEKLRIPTIILALPMALFGKHILFPGVTVHKVHKCTITCEESLWVHSDGEALYEDTSLTMEVLPACTYMMKP